jgi:CRP-like cAMP-binding protein
MDPMSRGHSATGPGNDPAANARPAQLDRLSVFEGMDLMALERMSAGATEIELYTGAVLYRRGESSNGLFLVMEGAVKLCLQAPQGAERVVEIVRAGGCFGETALIGVSAHMLTAEVVARARLVHLSRAVVQEELSRTPAFTQWIISSLTDRLKCVIQAFEDCTLRTASERVAGYLISHLPPGSTEGSVTVRLDTKKGTIAAQLNLTQEHFSRVLRDFSTRGLIEVRGRVLLVFDVARLMQMVESEGVPTRHR